MALVDESRTVAVGAVSPATVVAMRSTGACLAATSERPERALRTADLLVLAALAADEAADVAALVERTGAEATEVEALLEELAARGQLLDEAAAAAARPPVVRARRGPSPEPGEPPAFEALGDEPVVVALPLVLRILPEGYELLDHDGARLELLSATEAVVLSLLSRGLPQKRSFRGQRRELGQRALTDRQFCGLLERLYAAGLLTLGGDDAVGAPTMAAHTMREELARTRRMAASIDAELRRCDEEEADRRRRTGVVRTRVVPVQHNGTLAPLALGMLFAYAKAHDGGRLEERYQFYPAWMTRTSHVEQLVAEHPGIFLFSNYHWSHAENLEVSAEVKARSPRSLTIHGGPDTPKYRGDVEAYFAANPHVDVAVHGEGEATFAELLEALADQPVDGPFDLSVLQDVAGLSYRAPDGVVTTGSRDRIADLDTIPSPYLTGLFDAYGESAAPTAIIESNRGCPYGCTFCDWGSATGSRIRKFDLDRVLAELEWCARRGVPRIFMADANFGIFERDVAIAEKVAELKQQHGNPRSFVTNYAKNTVKHLQRIVEVMVEAGIFTEGLLSLQSMDETTLDTIRRSNIKLEKYEALAGQFRSAGLPLYVDLMLGLPGSTVRSFMDDIQQCVDREITAKVFLTELLVNSPMNEPAYREEHAIETAVDTHGVYRDKQVAPGTTNRALLVSTASYTRADYERMKDLRIMFLLCENHGVLRQVSRHVRQVTGRREVDLYVHLRDVAKARSATYPALWILFEHGPHLMVPPVSWRLFLDEVRAVLVDELGVPDDSALEAVLQVQHALLPARDRRFPVVLELEHDVAAWHRAVVDAKDVGHQLDWPELVPALAEMGPATFEVTDPSRVCTQGLGFPIGTDGYANWELGSPVGRTLPARHLV